MKNILHLKPKVMCNLYVSGELINQKQNTADIIVTSENTYISVEPLDYHYSPYSFRCYDDTCPYTDYIPFPNHCDLIISPPPLYDYSRTTKLFYEIVGKYYVDIFACGKCFVVITDGKQELLRFETIMFLSAYAYMLGEYLVIIGSTGVKTQVIVLDMTTKSSIHNIIADSIEIKDDTIITLSKNQDIAFTGLVQKIMYDKELKAESYYVFLEEHEREPYNSHIIPMTFLQSVKIKNYNYAISLLDFPSTTEHLTEYFGEIRDIYLNKYFDSPNEVNITIFNGKYTNYTFKINETKIIDIEENKL